MRSSPRPNPSDGARRATPRPDRNPLYAAADPPASGRCPTGRYAPRGPCPWGPSELPAHYARSSKLLQVAQVVLIEEPNVWCSRPEHCESLDAASKCESLVTRGVVAEP